MTIKEKNAQFYKALEHWKEYKDKESWGIMWERVINCCEAICKKKAVGKNITDLYDIIMDSASYSMDLISREHYPKYLYTFCNFNVLRYMYPKNKQLNDRALSWEDILDNNEEIEDWTKLT